MEFLGYVSSAFMGVVLGLIGGGGSILTVPILVYLFGLAPVLATGSSLFVVGTTAMTGALRSAKNGNLRIREGLFFALPSVIGVLSARRLILPLVPARLFDIGGMVVTKDILLMLLFAFLMLLASLKMLRSSGPRTQEINTTKLNVPGLILRGLLVGLVTGFIGAGGGFLIVPALVFLLGLKMSEAVGTSLLIIAVNSLVGFAGSLGNEPLYWQILGPMTVLAVIGLLLGSRLQKKFSEDQLKKSFGWFVLVVGGLILLDQVLRMQV